MRSKIDRLRTAMYSRKMPSGFGRAERHSLPRLTPDTPDDWVDPDDSAQVSGSTIAPRAIRYTRRALWWLLGISIVFFLAALGAFAWYLAGGFGPDVRGSNIDIQVDGPLSVVGGEPAELQITVTNRNKSPLQYADLVVTYPPGTRSVTDLSTPLPSQRISLGTVPAGGTRQGTVSAVLVGQGGQQGDINVSVEYQVEGSSAIFTADKDYTFAFGASPVTLAIDSKTEAIPGQPMSLTATVSANASTVLRNVQLTLVPPFGFTLSGATPTPSSPDVWNLGDLRPGDVKQIQLTGILAGQPGDQRTFRFEVGTQSATSTDAGVPLATESQLVSIAQPFIGLSVAVNGDDSGKPAVITPGQPVTVTVNWQNELDTPISNAVLAASLDGFAIDGTTVQSPDGFYRSSDNTVQWDANTSHGELATLPPHGTGSVSFSFMAPGEADVAALRNPSLNIAIHAAGDRGGEQDVPENLDSSAVRSIRMQTTASVIAQGFHHTIPASFTTDGPLPLKVNQETTYIILWTVSNSTNPLTGAKITAQLPPYVRYTGISSDASGSQLQFDKKNGTVTWNIGDIPAGATGSQSRQVAFEVGITPSATQVGQTPALVTSQRFSASDAFTGTTLAQALPDISTSQPNDPGFNGAEAVVTK